MPRFFRATRKISLFAAALLCGGFTANAATYYVSQSTGDDSLDGLAAAKAGAKGPWKTLAKASIEYKPGDSILLKRGDTWNEEFTPKGSGTPERPILISSYGQGNKPLIDREDYKQDRTGIRLDNKSGYKVVGIEFSRCMTGIYAEYAKGAPTQKYLWIEDCYFRDSLFYGRYEDYPKRKIGLGVCLFSRETDKKIVMQDIMVKNCVFRRLASGFWTNSPDNFNKNASFVYNFANLHFEGYQWQLGIRGVLKGSVKNCVTHDVGRGFRSFNGVAGAMFFRCKDWIFEDSEWGFVDIGLGSGDGEAFDFEGNCDNMVMRNCNFHDTDGPGFLLCCYASDGHPNMGIVMENCVINAKSKRPLQPRVRAAIINTTDWTEASWIKCRFYLSKGEGIMAVMDREKDKRSTFKDCFVKNLSAAGSSLKHPAKLTEMAAAAGATGPAFLLDFGHPVSINEFKLKEDPASGISRYIIETWDDQKSQWKSCFNGMGIGGEFVCAIVPQTTSKARLRVIANSKEKTALTAFDAYNDPQGDALNVARGGDTPNRSGK
jgi:hypothetical protein